MNFFLKKKKKFCEKYLKKKPKYFGFNEVFLQSKKIILDIFFYYYFGIICVYMRINYKLYTIFV